MIRLKPVVTQAVSSKQKQINAVSKYATLERPTPLISWAAEYLATAPALACYDLYVQLVSCHLLHDAFLVDQRQCCLLASLVYLRIAGH